MMSSSSTGSMTTASLGVPGATGMKDTTKMLTKSGRPDWDEYFLGIARAVSTRADCSRARHGAVIVKDRRIVATGYNGAVAGQPGCLAGHCPRARSSCESLSGYDNCIAVHAEANALLYADRDKCENATIYITGRPCQWCERLIYGAGIARVVW